MNANALIQGDYITADEFGGKEPTLTITKVALVKLEQDDGRAKNKGVVWFKGTERGWVLNRTNVLLLVALFGNETDAWIGKRVTLHAQAVKFGGETKNGIRVKGSPDLARAINVEVKLPRRKAQHVKLVPTGRPATQQAAQTASSPARQPEPPPIDDTPPPPPEDESVFDNRNDDAQ